ncbi:energy-coupling factor ABC transporter ATP-binding protein [Clostridiaceae bacterium M8S5]|nr:energy-coupling factor ABC transporter ATP-binding protein [Clostridiaceae bacterium M8S5]
MIELNNVSFTYDNEENEVIRNGIKNINLKVKKGELVLICGESGCGKTTITRLINGLIPNFYEGNLQGEVLIDNIKIANQPLYETAKKVGSVFQNPRSQFFNVDTTSEIVFGCENMGLPMDTILSRLDNINNSLKMNKLLDRSLFALSGGEKQKIACASVAAMSPEIFVLDEPSSNLDILSIYDLKEVIKVWRKEGKTIVVAEHRLHYLIDIVDRVIYMKSGKIIMDISRTDFTSMSSDRISQLGLRSLDTIEFDKLKYIKKEENIEDKIKFKNFKVAYDKKQVLNITNLELPRNEIIGIIGKNGAGKTTFSKCLCGLLKSLRAKLSINDKEYSTKQRQKICYMVMQDVNHQLFTERVLDEILLSMEGVDEQKDIIRAEKILKSLNLLDKKELHPMSLSGGEKQRVAIGSAIASSKEIILFDEPTSGLDYRHMVEVSENIKLLKKLGKSIFVVTHDAELIKRCCTHIVNIDEGQVV